MTEVKVCIGTCCHLKGSYNVICCFQKMIEQYNLHDKVNLSAVLCTNNCRDDVCVIIDDTVYNVTVDEARAFFKSKIMK